MVPHSYPASLKHPIDGDDDASTVDCNNPLFHQQWTSSGGHRRSKSQERSRRVHFSDDVQYIPIPKEPRTPEELQACFYTVSKPASIFEF